MNDKQKHRISQYRNAFNRIAQGEDPEAVHQYMNAQGMRNGLLSIAGQHLARVRQAETTDEQNRIECFTHTWVYEDFVGRLVQWHSLQEDPVYKEIIRLLPLRRDIFKRLRSEEPLRYCNNSRKNPLAKKHREYFFSALEEAIKRFDERRMTEEEYETIHRGSEEWVRSVYHATRHKMEKDRGRQRALWDATKTIIHEFIDTEPNELVKEYLTTLIK